MGWEDLIEKQKRKIMITEKAKFCQEAVQCHHLETLGVASEDSEKKIRAIRDTV